MDSRAEKLWQRGMEHFRQGNMQAAQAKFDAFLAREPNSGPGRFRLSMVHARLRRNETALALIADAQAIDPDRIEVLAQLARCQLACGLPEAARATALRALALPGASAGVLDALATVMTRLDEQVLALELFDRALSLGAAEPSKYFNRALALRQFGQVEAAEDDLRRCLALNPAHAKAHWALSGLRTQPDTGHREQLAARLAIGLAPQERELTALALFRDCDTAGDTDAAWPALATAIAARTPRTLDGAAGVVDTVIAHHAARPMIVLQPRTRAFAPVFVLGMPRSGVALLGKLLSRHARVHHLGQVAVFPRLLERALGRDTSSPLLAADLAQAPHLDFDALGQAYRAATEPAGGQGLIVCESTPVNYALAGLIARALPGARFLHVRRDPLDACLSLLAQPGDDTGWPTHDPAALADAYLQHHRLERHWHAVLPGRLMDVDYESLVAKPDMVLRVVCGFLGIRYGASLRMGLSLHERGVGRAQRYLHLLPALQAGLRPLYDASQRA